MQISRKVMSLCICACIVLMSLAFQMSSVSALTVPSLYGDLNNGTQFNNLFNYAARFDSFYNSAYIGFRASQNSYFLAWGDKDEIAVSGSVVTSPRCSYVRYYRESTTADWKYLYTEDDTLSVTCDKFCTTNIPTVQGFESPEVYDWDFFQSVRRMIITLGSMFIGVGLALAIRRR